MANMNNVSGIIASTLRAELDDRTTAPSEHFCLVHAIQLDGNEPYFRYCLLFLYGG
jgi:hypothetical protein